MDGCDKPSHAQGLCDKHYWRLRKHGDPSVTTTKQGMPEMDRFWSYVDKDTDAGGCWLWQLAPTSWGYGQFRKSDGTRDYAHRISYEAIVGPIPDGLVIDHLCRNRMCVNPEHLEPVPHATNILRGVSPWAENARKTHCPQGHPYDEVNTYINYAGYRECRACLRIYDRKRWPRKYASWKARRARL